MLKLESSVVRAAYVVDRSLRSYFPHDFQARCMYAAYGTQAVLRQFGYSSRINVGTFGMFSVSRDGRRSAMDAWGGRGNTLSHFWCVVENRIIDPTSPYMAMKGSFEKADAPIVYWNILKEMPKSFRYYYAADLSPRSPDTYDDDMKKRLREFVQTCESKAREIKGQPRMKYWLLKDMHSIKAAADRGDTWAKAALRLQKMPGDDQLQQMLLTGDLQERIPVFDPSDLSKSWDFAV